MPRAPQNWCPFRPGVQELEKIRGEVAEVRSIQQRILAKSEQIRFPDRVAHQYQIAGSKVLDLYLVWFSLGGVFQADDRYCCSFS